MNRRNFIKSAASSVVLSSAVLGLSANATECDSPITILPISLLPEFHRGGFEAYVRSTFRPYYRFWDGIHIKAHNHMGTIVTTVSVNKSDENESCSELRVYAEVEGITKEEWPHLGQLPARHTHISTFLIASVVLSENAAPYFSCRSRFIAYSMSIGAVAKITRSPIKKGMPAYHEYRYNLSRRIFGHGCGNSYLSDS
jgi:hypothetical protein